MWTRTAHGFKHWTRGPQVEWEDALFLVFDLKWRQMRDDQCATLADWRARLQYFIDAVCRHWGLPSIRRKMPQIPASLEPSVEPTAKRIKRLTLDMCPLQHHSQSSNAKTSCEKGRSEFLFIVDCQPVQLVACGHAPLLAQDSRPMFDRISANFVGIIDAGWDTPQRWCSGDDASATK